MGLERWTQNMPKPLVPSHLFDAVDWFVVHHENDTNKHDVGPDPPSKRAFIREHCPAPEAGVFFDIICSPVYPRKFVLLS